MFAMPRTAAASYRNVDLETSVAQADPHQLVTMLFDGAVTAISLARQSLREGSTARKGEATGRAVRIIEEGLKASLDARGGELASNLHALYDYMGRRLLTANLHNDDAQYAEVQRMLEQLRESWKGIAAQVRAMPAPASHAAQASARPAVAPRVAPVETGAWLAA